ncbi:hypothetical protein GCM10023310_70040 [Paenibacillus vulneris]|uniref:Accessory gene regulator B family protein n=1 Tax=Paenibacillus vulneris TaxID=1133364 RepID=A0ABW3UFT5_9BACL
MVDRLATLFSLYIKSKVADSRSIEVINYGMIIIFNLLFTIAMSFSIALLLGILEKTLIVFVVFVLFRQFAGGYHLKNCDACVITSTIILIAIPYIDLNIQLEILDVLSILLVLWLAPNTKKFTKRSDSRRYIIYKVVPAVLILFNVIVIKSSLVSLTLFTASLSLLLAHVRDWVELRNVHAN